MGGFRRRAELPRGAGERVKGMARRAPNARPADRGPTSVSGGGRRGFRLNADGP